MEELEFRPEPEEVTHFLDDPNDLGALRKLVAGAPKKEPLRLGPGPDAQAELESPKPEVPADVLAAVRAELAAPRPADAQETLQAAPAPSTPEGATLAEARSALRAALAEPAIAPDPAEHPAPPTHHPAAVAPAAASPPGPDGDQGHRLEDVLAIVRADLAAEAADDRAPAPRPSSRRAAPPRAPSLAPAQPGLHPASARAASLVPGRRARSVTSGGPSDSGAEAVSAPSDAAGTGAPARTAAPRGASRRTAPPRPSTSSPGAEAPVEDAGDLPTTFHRPPRE